MSFVKSKSKIIQKRQIMGLDYIQGSSSTTNERTISTNLADDLIRIAGENLTAGYPVYLLNGMAYLSDLTHPCEYFCKETVTSGNNAKLVNIGVIQSPVLLDENKEYIYLGNPISQYPSNISGEYWQIIGKTESQGIQILINEAFLNE